MWFENGKQRHDFHDALLSAFPQIFDLEKMFRFKFNKNLHEIATGENLSEVVFKVIQWAESQGRLEELIKAASEYNRENPQLKKFCQQYLRKQPVEESTQQQSQPTPRTLSTTSRQIEEDDNLSSERGVDYTRLRDLLKAGEWKEADEETFIVMLRAAGSELHGHLSIEDIEKFPSTDLRTIDQLWVKYSIGRFGFSVQKRIWESVGKDFGKFGYRVGWRIGALRAENKFYTDLIFSTGAPEGHLPCMSCVGGFGGLGCGWVAFSSEGESLLSRPDL